MRSLLIDCRRLLSERGAANSVAIAQSLVARFNALTDDQQGTFFERLSSDFGPKPQLVLTCAQAYAAAPNASNLQQLLRQVEPPRQELLRRINRLPGGTSSIVAMRQALLERLNRKPELRAVEADFLHLLSSWFNPGFLQLTRVDWNSPAQLLEKIIQHEAVHAIDGWSDLRRRLQPDRRCFAFFHPQLPQEPLIFVEVALLAKMPAAIAPLIGQESSPTAPKDFKVAAFYSISNCEPGLRGVSMGNFLIKRVAMELQRELPQVRTSVRFHRSPHSHGGFAAAQSAPARRRRVKIAFDALISCCSSAWGSTPRHFQARRRFEVCRRLWPRPFCAWGRISSSANRRRPKATPLRVFISTTAPASNNSVCSATFRAKESGSRSV